MLAKRDAICALFALFFLTVGIITTPSVMAVQGLESVQDSTPAADYNFGSRESPISILLYTEFADMSESSNGEYANTNKSIRSAYGQRYLKDNLDDYTQLGAMIYDYNVLVVLEQEDANASMIADIAGAWSSFIANWVEDGGIIICMGYWEEELGDTHRLLNDTGLMELYDPVDRAYDSVIKTLSNHALAFGVSSSFSGPDGTVGYTTSDGDVVFEASGAAVVVDKAIGRGHVVMLGFDFFDRSPDSDRIFANAIRLTKHVVFDASNDAYFNPLSGYYNFGLFLTDVGFSVSTMTVWDEALILASDIFVASMGNGEGYSPSEIAFLEQFVAGGGALLVTTDWGTFGNNTDSLLAEFGFARNQTAGYLADSDDNYGNVAQPYYDLGENLANHSSTFHVNRVQMFASSAFIQTPAEAVALVFADSDGTESWGLAAESAAGITIGAALLHGAGRVIAIADGDFLSDEDSDVDGTDNFLEEHNEVFAINSMSWLLAAGLPEKTVLVDNSHGSYISITAGDWNEFGMFLTMNGFNIMWMNHFSEDLVDMADVLLLLSGSLDYTPSEVATVVDFVSRGGGLFAIGDQQMYSERVSVVTTQFGISYNTINGSIWEDDDYDTYNQYLVYNESNFASHPIMNGVSRMEFDLVGGFNATGSGTALCSTDDDGTAHWYYTVVTGLASEVPLTVATQYNLGRVVAIADYNLATSTDPEGDSFYTIFDSDNAVFLANSFYWLVENRAPIPEIVAPNGGEVLDGTVTITWTAIDANRDELTFDLYYSDNGGTDWNLLIGDLTGHSYAWDTTLQDDGDEYLVRVVAFDGYVDVYDDSDAVFELDNYAGGIGLNPALLAVVGAGIVVVVIVIIFLQKRGTSPKE